MVIGVDIDKVLFDDAVDGAVGCDEIGKTQAPGAPVAAHLADDKLAFLLSLQDSLVNLLQRINLLVIHFLECFLFLAICCY